jgi:hypothetical protein
MVVGWHVMSAVEIQKKNFTPILVFVQLKRALRVGVIRF